MEPASHTLWKSLRDNHIRGRPDFLATSAGKKKVYFSTPNTLSVQATDGTLPSENQRNSLGKIVRRALDVRRLEKID